ncbi:MAG: M16 family metallopeptidase [Sphingomicrobium sp.]
MIRRMFTAAAAALALVFSPVAATAQDFPTQMPPAGEPPSFVVPAAETFRLPNGMQVTLVPYGFVPKALISLRIYSGNLNEGENVWLSDLTGQMLREGAAGRTGAQIADAAAAMGGNLEVGVGVHETSLSLNVLSEHADEAVALIADVALRPDFPETELERVRSSLLRNLAVAQTQPQSTADAALAASYYGDHPYGRLFPTEAQLKAYSVEDVRRFYSANFGAERARLYVAGRFDPAAVRAAIEKSYSAWARGPERLRLPPQPRPGPQVVLVDRPGAAQSTIRLAFPAPVAGSPGDIPLRVSNALLGGAFSSRITTNIREAKGYTYSPFSGITLNAGESLWTFDADVTTAVTGPALKEVFYEVRRMQNEPIPEPEAAGMRQYIAGLFILQNASPAGVINQLSTRDFHNLPPTWLETYVPAVLSVSAERMKESARTSLPLDRMTLVVVGDLKKVRPQLRQVPELRDAQMKVVKPF